jgi:hypothetical protein
MIGVVGSLAEFEQELVKERTPLKRVTSRANGRKFGRHRKVDDTEHIATAKRMKADGHTAKDIAKYLGVSRPTLYRYLSEHGDFGDGLLASCPPPARGPARCEEGWRHATGVRIDDREAARSP